MLTGKSVFITGASSGIGQACAELFAQAGANLIIAARRKDRLESLAHELFINHKTKVKPILLDVQKFEQVDNGVRELLAAGNSIDVLINNAGLALSIDKIQNADVNNWDTMIDTNIKGLLYVTRAVLPHMCHKNAGHIINIGSIAGHECYPGGNIYSATKHAVRAISKSLRLDLLGYNIRVTEIDPGAVHTEFSEVRLKNKEKALKVYEGYQPLIARDIADAALYSATRSPHVNISEIVIHPQAQAAVTQVFRK